MRFDAIPASVYFIAGGFFLGGIFSYLQKPIKGRWSNRARKYLALFQLAKWGCWLLSFGFSIGAFLSWAGVPTTVLAILGGGLATGFAFALRDPLADFIAAISLLVDKVANIGADVTINGDLSGKIISFGLRGVTLETWRGDHIYVSAASIASLKNTSRGDSTAVIEIDVPSNISTSRASNVLLEGIRKDPRFNLLNPEVVGVEHQFLDRYVLTIICKVPPAEHKSIERKLKSVCVDSLITLTTARSSDDTFTTQEIQAML